jgi:hypothetical protein
MTSSSSAYRPGVDAQPMRRIGIAAPYSEPVPGDLGRRAGVLAGLRGATACSVDGVAPRRRSPAS